MHKVNPKLQTVNQCLYCNTNCSSTPVPQVTNSLCSGQQRSPIFNSKDRYNKLTLSEQNSESHCLVAYKYLQCSKGTRSRPSWSLIWAGDCLTSQWLPVRSYKLWTNHSQPKSFTLFQFFSWLLPNLCQGTTSRGRGCLVLCFLTVRLSLVLGSASGPDRRV